MEPAMSMEKWAVKLKMRVFILCLNLFLAYCIVIPACFVGFVKFALVF